MADLSEEPTYFTETHDALTHFICLLCGYDSLSLNQLEIHMGFLHPGLPLIPNDRPETPAPDLPEEPAP